jgi:hypothetical protein
MKEKLEFGTGYLWDWKEDEIIFFNDDWLLPPIVGVD